MTSNTAFERQAAPGTPTMLHGSCLCRAVRYQIDADISHIENCHCSMCRKAHGAAFSTNALVPSASLTIQGEENLRAYNSSPNRQKLFCSICGSQLFIKRLNSPAGMVVTLGTLDSNPNVAPSRHVFVGSKASWFSLDADLPVFQVYPDHESE